MQLLNPIRAVGARGKAGAGFAGALLAGTALGLILGAPARADEAADGGQVSELMVVAQKRSENIQEVPISITAFTAAQLADGAVTDLQGVTTLDTSLIIGEGTGQAVPFLRGVGNPIRNAGDEASTSIYIDGFYYSRLPAAMFELNNIDRVEILKGPQGTLFGRNSEGGLVNIITRDPGHSPVLEASVGYGNYDTTRTSFYGAAPIGYKVALDLSFLSVTQGKGWGRDTVTGAKTGYEDATAVRAKLVITPGAETEIKLFADYINTASTDGLSSSAYAGTTQGSLLAPNVQLPKTSFYDIQDNINNVAGERGWSTGLRIQQDLGFASLVSLTGYRRTTEHLLQDGDDSPADLVDLSINDFSAQTSQELQLISKSKAPLDWIVGLYYLDQTSGYTPDKESGLVFRGVALDLFSNTGDVSYAAYGQANYDILPQLKLTLGARYTADHVTANAHSDTATPAVYIPGAVTSGGKDFDKATYKAGLDYKVGPDTIAYVSYSTSFKAGMFITAPPITQPLAPESIKAVEIGAKTELFDHRLRLNAALFHYAIDNYQVQAVQVLPSGAITGTYINAPRVHSEGFDMNGEAAITPDLSSVFGLTLLDAKFDDFANAPFYPALSGPTFGNGPEAVASADGHYLPRSPKLAANIGFNYRLNTQIGRWVFSPNYSYHSSYDWDPDNQHRQAPVGLLDATLSFTPTNSEHWTVRLWGKNLTGVKYYWGENEIAGAMGTPGVVAPPMTFGVTLSYKH